MTRFLFILKINMYENVWIVQLSMIVIKNSMEYLDDTQAISRSNMKNDH